MTKEEEKEVKLSSKTTTTQGSSIEDRPLTVDEITEIRSKAKEIFQSLKDHPPHNNPTSWIRPSHDEDEAKDKVELSSSASSERTDRCRYFDSYGFLHVPQFCNDVQALKTQMETLANHDWDPSASDAKVVAFGTDAASNKARGDYFLDSSNRVHYFAEPQALEQQPQEQESSTTTSNNEEVAVHQKTVLKEEYQANKLAALNKAGHGMHIIPGPFQDYTLSPNIQQLVTELGWEDPIVPQSMYIFKQPKIGGTVHSHQDSTFLYTTPKQSCLGLWLALDDATLENGCLWVRPGSHVEPLRRQFVRNPAYFEPTTTTTTDEIEGATVKKRDEEDTPSSSPPPKLIFEYHHDNPNVPWEGGLPQPKTEDNNNTAVGIHETLLEAGFVPVECKAGDLVTFCGTLDHLSLPNYSTSTRHTFQLHLIEGPKAGVTWSPKNWLQYPPDMPFLSLTTKRCG